MDAFDREVEALEEDYANGNLSLKEFNYEMRELERSWRDHAEEAAQRAYEDEIGRW